MLRPLPEQILSGSSRFFDKVVLFAVLAFGLNALPSLASAALLIKVDKSTQTLTVARDGQVLHTWPVSTGKTGYATPSGNFTAFRMEADHFSKEWDDAPMPHSVFFTKQGHAIHGSFDVKRLGSPASHGCVRLAPANAAVLFALVKQEGLPNTQVLLTGSEQVALERMNAKPTASGSRRTLAGQAPDDALRTGSVRTLPPPLSIEPSARSEYAHPGYQPRYMRPPPYGDPPPERPRYVNPNYPPPEHAQPRFERWRGPGLAQREPDDGYRPPHDARRDYDPRYANPYDARPRYAPRYDRRGFDYD